MLDSYQILPAVTIGIVNYNGLSSLSSVIDTAKVIDYPNFRIIVADNASIDGSRDWLKINHKDIRCLSLPFNQGPAGARNAILKASDTPYILFLDNDITLEKDTLKQLVKIAETMPRIAACHPEICDENDPHVYHYNGGKIHYLGAFISRDLPTGERPFYEIFDIVSGGALLVRRRAAEAVGAFDKDYFFNWEDGDFVARLTLSGYQCVNVPGANVHHIGKPRGAQKAYYMVRNRWFFILKLYDFKTIILLFPALLVFEIIQGSFLLVNGNLLAYLQGNVAVLKNLPKILKKRQKFQTLKIIQDKDWLHSGEIFTSQSLLANKPLINRLRTGIFQLFNLYWQFIRPLCARSVMDRGSISRKTS